MALPTSKIPAVPFEISSFARAPKFPAIRFTSKMEFQDFLTESQGMLDARYAYEQTLATREPKLLRQGTCAPCLRAATFTSSAENGNLLKDGRSVPNWREGMRCDCRDHLNNRQRALLHFVQATGVLPWTRLLLLGAPVAVDARLASMVSEIVPIRPFLATPEPNAFHLAVSHEYLQHVPPLTTVLTGLYAAMMDGGRFIFTVPFHYNAATSELIDISRFDGKVPGEFQEGSHKLGWDLLDKLRSVGFRDAAAYLYWSDLGPMNFLFRAVK
jgi:hypothetical protein